MTTRLSGFSAQLHELKEQLGTFAENVAPTLDHAKNEAAVPVQKLLNYMELALQYLPRISSLVERLASRSGQAAVAARAVPSSVKRRRRHRALITGVTIGAGLIAYGLYSGHLAALARRYSQKA